MPRTSAGLTIVVAGIALVLVGLLVWSGALSWFGRLPGNVRFYFPITSTVLVSVVLSVAAAVLRRLR